VAYKAAQVQELSRRTCSTLEHGSEMKALRNRWDDVLANSDRAVLLPGRCAKSPFGTIEGREDWRGLPLTKLGRTHSDILFENADLSFADLKRARFRECTFSNVVLNRTDLRGVGDHGNHFRGCVFSTCRLEAAMIGYQGSRFDNCMFSHCSHSRIVFIRAEFNDCDFECTSLRNVDFGASSFERCSFVGRLEDVWFRGGFPLASDEQTFGRPRPNRMHEVSFERASLHWITISNGCDLSTVRMPDDGGVHLIHDYDNRIQRLRDHPSEDVQRFLAVHSVHSNNWGILNREDLIAEYGEHAASEILETILR